MDIITAGKFIKMAKIKEEWYEDVEDPERLIEDLKKAGCRADIFTFWQRLPETEPRFNYPLEWESIAAIPITSFKHWWERQIDTKTRNMIRKAEKKGVEVRMADFNDDFIEGMTKIFNDSPIRQGRPFWHYGKDFITVKQEFVRNLFREDLIGAYYMDELIGFIMLADAGRYADITQIISLIKHRDKSPINALLAKAVEICDKKGIPYLVYAKWVGGTLGEFKKHNGFQRVNLPRYYVPLNWKGKIVLKLHLHHGLSGILPERILLPLKELRAKWYSMKK